MESTVAWRAGGSSPMFCHIVPLPSKWVAACLDIACPPFPVQHITDSSSTTTTGCSPDPVYPLLLSGSFKSARVQVSVPLTAAFPPRWLEVNPARYGMVHATENCRHLDFSTTMLLTWEYSKLPDNLATLLPHFMLSVAFLALH